MAKSISLAPDMFTYRTATDDVDAGPFESQGEGINCAGHKHLLVNVVPSESADPDVEVLFWSPAASAFISNNPPLAYGGMGAGVPYSFSVQAYGRLAFVAVTAGVVADDSVIIETSSFGLDQAL